MIIQVQFFNHEVQHFSGKCYTYLCELPVKVGDHVLVPAGEETTVARVVKTNMSIQDCDISPRMMKEVISVETNIPPSEREQAAEPEAEQLSILDEAPAQEPPADLIVIKQLPVIEESLHQLKDSIRDTVKNALSLAVTEDTVKDVKKTRAELNNKFKELEALRKEVKKKILSPYDAFEKVYGECVTDIFVPADQELKRKIDAVEEGLKSEKREVIRKYFEEYSIAYGLNDFVTFDNCGIKINLSDSEKSLKSWAKAYLDTVKTDIDAIGGMEFADEILAEYRVTRALNTAVQAVNERHARIEAERRRREEEAEAAAARREAEAAAEAKVKEAMQQAAPVEMPPVEQPAAAAEEPAEEEIFVEFRVYGDIEKLRALKKFLNDGGYRYVNI